MSADFQKGYSVSEQEPNWKAIPYPGMYFVLLPNSPKAATKKTALPCSSFLRASDVISSHHLH
jgi:hypothetical protein